MKYFTIAATALALTAGAAGAATFHDEAIDGDLTNFLSTVGSSANPFFDLTTAGSYTIVGTLDAGGSGTSDGVDEFDTFQFSVSGDFTVDLTTISGLTFGTLYDDGGGCCFSFAGSGSSGTDIFASLGTLPAGTYGFGVVPSGNSGVHSYSLTINTTSGIPDVPLPAGFPLLAAGLIGMGALARRKKAA
ncbi:VPLPA-CTERM sorting domain-containing protein [Litorivita sp. NS0012-18]|uniref:VPLPA-CTERM sorting domain-containing protein n=1 Tax=Litorivita sp. NS0012-18 TaxID=3127655 RepID=UPI003104388B